MTDTTLPEDWLAIMRGEMLLIGGLGELVTDDMTLCPVRGCSTPLHTNPALRFGLLCENLHTYEDMNQAVHDEWMVDADAQSCELDEWVESECLLTEQMIQRIAQLTNVESDGGDAFPEIPIDDVIGGLAPRYPSILRDLEFYGIVTTVAEGGLGKSQIAIGTALEAAYAGWQVAYFNAELDAPELKERITRYAMSDPGGRPLIETLHRISWRGLGTVASRMALAKRAAMSVRRGRRLLIILDSITTIAEACADPRQRMSDLVETAMLYNWAVQVRKGSEGDIAFLLISETNAQGGVKGRKGFFASDVVLRISDAGDNKVELTVAKGRSSGRSELGIFNNEWKRGRFVR